MANITERVSLGENGYISIIRQYLPMENTTKYFKAISNLKWNSTLSSDSRTPNLKEFWFGAQAYSYAGVTHRSNESWDPTVHELLRKVNSMG